jgi:ribosomal protection tetracycline resistance protein
LRLALAQLAEQDPLIDVRDEPGRELTVSLYGEVQKEVIEATLVQDFGVDAVFRETTPICVERPARTGEALEVLHAETNPYNATIGLRVGPAPDNSGLEFRLDVPTRNIPLYVYKTRESFREQMERYTRAALGEGLSGWQVVDCVVTMTQCAYSVADGPPSLRGPTSTAADFRKLTPLVLAQALERAGTVVCEPVVRLTLDVPTRSVGAVLPALARLGAAVETPVPRGELSTVGALLPVTRADELQRQLPGLTGGEGVAESAFAGYQPVGGAPVRRTADRRTA